MDDIYGDLENEPLPRRDREPTMDDLYGDLDGEMPDQKIERLEKEVEGKDSTIKDLLIQQTAGTEREVKLRTEVAQLRAENAKVRAECAKVKSNLARFVLTAKNEVNRKNRVNSETMERLNKVLASRFDRENLGRQYRRILSDVLSNYDLDRDFTRLRVARKKNEPSERPRPSEVEKKQHNAAEKTPRVAKDLAESVVAAKEKTDAPKAGHSAPRASNDREGSSNESSSKDKAPVKAVQSSSKGKTKEEPPANVVPITKCGSEKDGTVCDELNPKKSKTMVSEKPANSLQGVDSVKTFSAPAGQDNNQSSANNPTCSSEVTGVVSTDKVGVISTGPDDCDTDDPATNSATESTEKNKRKEAKGVAPNVSKVDEKNDAQSSVEKPEESSDLRNRLRGLASCSSPKSSPLSLLASDSPRSRRNGGERDQGRRRRSRERSRREERRRSRERGRRSRSRDRGSRRRRSRSRERVRSRSPRDHRREACKPVQMERKLAKERLELTREVKSKSREPELPQPQSLEATVREHATNVLAKDKDIDAAADDDEVEEGEIESSDEETEQQVKEKSPMKPAPAPLRRSPRKRPGPRETKTGKEFPKLFEFTDSSTKDKCTSEEAKKNFSKDKFVIPKRTKEQSTFCDPKSETTVNSAKKDGKKETVASRTKNTEESDEIDLESTVSKLISGPNKMPSFLDPPTKKTTSEPERKEIEKMQKTASSLPDISKETAEVPPGNPPTLAGSAIPQKVTKMTVVSEPTVAPELVPEEKSVSVEKAAASESRTVEIPEVLKNVQTLEKDKSWPEISGSNLKLAKETLSALAAEMVEYPSGESEMVASNPPEKNVPSLKSTKNDDVVKCHEHLPDVSTKVCKEKKDVPEASTKSEETNRKPSKELVEESPKSDKENNPKRRKKSKKSKDHKEDRNDEKRSKKSPKAEKNADRERSKKAHKKEKSERRSSSQDRARLKVQNKEESPKVEKSGSDKVPKKHKKAKKKKRDEKEKRRSSENISFTWTKSTIEADCAVIGSDPESEEDSNELSDMPEKCADVGEVETASVSKITASDNGSSDSLPSHTAPTIIASATESCTTENLQVTTDVRASGTRPSEESVEPANFVSETGSQTSELSEKANPKTGADAPTGEVAADKEQDRSGGPLIVRLSTKNILAVEVTPESNSSSSNSSNSNAVAAASKLITSFVPEELVEMNSLDLEAKIKRRRKVLGKLAAEEVKLKELISSGSSGTDRDDERPGKRRQPSSDQVSEERRIASPPPVEPEANVTAPVEEEVNYSSDSPDEDEVTIERADACHKPSTPKKPKNKAMIIDLFGEDTTQSPEKALTAAKSSPFLRDSPAPSPQPKALNDLGPDEFTPPKKSASPISYSTNKRRSRSRTRPLDFTSASSIASILREVTDDAEIAPGGIICTPTSGRSRSSSICSNVSSKSQVRSNMLKKNGSPKLSRISATQNTTPRRSPRKVIANRSSLETIFEASTSAASKPADSDSKAGESTVTSIGATAVDKSVMDETANLSTEDAFAKHANSKSSSPETPAGRVTSARCTPDGSTLLREDLMLSGDDTNTSKTPFKAPTAGPSSADLVRCDLMMSDTEMSPIKSDSRGRSGEVASVKESAPKSKEKMEEELSLALSDDSEDEGTANKTGRDRNSDPQDKSELSESSAGLDKAADESGTDDQASDQAKKEVGNGESEDEDLKGSFTEVKVSGTFEVTPSKNHFREDTQLGHVGDPKPGRARAETYEEEKARLKAEVAELLERKRLADEYKAGKAARKAQRKLKREENARKRAEKEARRREMEAKKLAKAAKKAAKKAKKAAKKHKKEKAPKVTSKEETKAKLEKVAKVRDKKKKAERSK